MIRMERELLAELHAPLIPFLRWALAVAPFAHAGLILDLACGDAAKWGLYRAALGPHVQLLGIDWRYSALSIADAVLPHQDEDLPGLRLVADAHRLPLRSACLDGAICVAALGLFHDAALALGELRGVLKPGAVALFVTAEQRWAYVWQWNAALAMRIAAACADLQPAPADPDLTGDLVALLHTSGYGIAGSMAAILETRLPEICRVLALLPWEVLQPLLADRLTPADLAACARSDRELELQSIALAAWGTA